IRGVGALVWAIAVLSSSCGNSSAESNRCSGMSSYSCAAFCGSDSVGATECVNGRWQCPDGYINGHDDCPVGTCFGPAAPCCNSHGDVVASGVCPSSPDLLSSGGGVCPAGSYDCTFGVRDGGAAGADAQGDGG
ncbi:MAG TPA: hypothetical protein VNW92_10865, partial [Polyangiaceae bacterium]|nr:hypothetical protein [Polyangiaceae bacterium]